MVSRKLWLGLALASALGSQACSETVARTQLMLVADTDIPGLDAIRFEISGDGRSEMAEATTLDQGPATLALVPEGEALGPLTVTARAVRNDISVVARSAVVSFVPHQTLVVELHLVASCIQANCKASETCTEHGCQPKQQNVDDLAVWSGEAPTLADSRDASASSDAAADAGVSADAGERVDCGAGAESVDLQSDVDHCGTCGNVCRATQRNMQPTCTQGICGVECRTLYGDCDDKPANGCEQLLNDGSHCGMCDLQCTTGTTCSLIGICR